MTDDFKSFGLSQGHPAPHYPSITRSMEESTRELRSNMDRIPHLVVGKKKSAKKLKKIRKDPRDFRAKPYIPSTNPEDNLRKLLLYGLTGLIITIVVVIVIVKLIKMIF